MKLQDLVREVQTTTDCTLKAAEKHTDEVFFAKQNPETWSRAEHLEHLTISMEPLIHILNKGAEAILNKTGTSGRESRTYSVMIDIYVENLGKVQGFPNPFSPQVTGKTKEELIAKFGEVHAAFAEVLQKYTENDLDSLQVKHPLLGLLTIREMTYFMEFHINHHKKRID